MSNKTDIDFTKANGALDKWKESNTYFEANCGNGIIKSSFSRIASGDDVAVATGYIDMLEKSVNDILDFSKNEQNKFASLVESLKPSDGGDTPKDPPGGSGDTPKDPPGGSGDTPIKPPSEVVQTPIGSGEEINTDDPTAPIEEPEIVVSTVDLDEIDISSLENMKLSDLDDFIGTLKELAKQKNKKLDEYFDDEENADDLKKAILESPYIPQEFKDYIKDLDSEVARQIIKYMLTGGYPNIFNLNPLNLGIIYRYLENIAKEKDMSITDLLTDIKNASILRTVLEDFSNVTEMIKGWEDLEPEELQANLLQLYDGDGVEDMPSGTVEVSRAFVDYICEEVGIDYEELLTDTIYAEDIKTAALEFGHALAFFAMTASFTDQGMMDNVSHLYDGTNYKALGMYEDSNKEFKEKIDEKAKEKNVTSEELLSDSQYAQDVKDAMAECDATKSISSIFKNSDAEISQGVAKNLYNTDYTQKNTFELKTEVSADGTTTTESESAAAA